MEEGSPLEKNLGQGTGQSKYFPNQEITSAFRDRRYRKIRKRIKNLEQFSSKKGLGQIWDIKSEIFTVYLLGKDFGEDVSDNLVEHEIPGLGEEIMEKMRKRKLYEKEYFYEFLEEQEFIIESLGEDNPIEKKLKEETLKMINKVIKEAQELFRKEEDFKAYFEVEAKVFFSKRRGERINVNDWLGEAQEKLDKISDDKILMYNRHFFDASVDFWEIWDYLLGDNNYDKGKLGVWVSKRGQGIDFEEDASLMRHYPNLRGELDDWGEEE